MTGMCEVIEREREERSHGGGEGRLGEEGDWVLGAGKGKERESKRKLLEIGLKGSVVNGAREEAPTSLDPLQSAPIGDRFGQD